MSKTQNNSDKTSEQKSVSIKKLGYSLVFIYFLFWLILGIIRWSMFPFDTQKDLNFTFVFSISSLSLATGVHLYSRSPLFAEGSPLRQLFRLMSLTFIPLFMIFSLQAVDRILSWFYLPTIMGTLNYSIPTVIFNFFGLEQFKTTMPPESIVFFELIIISIIFYLYPMEKFSGRKTIRTYLLALMALIIPLTPFVGDNVWFLSIASLIIILYLMYCFLYLFYLYFTTALKSPKGSVMRKGGLMIGFGLMLLISTWIIGWSTTFLGLIAQAILMYSVGLSAIFMFNYGFYIMRPINT